MSTTIEQITYPKPNFISILRALKSPQKFRTQSFSSANFLGFWCISGLKSKSYYEIFTFWITFQSQLWVDAAQSLSNLVILNKWEQASILYVSN